MVDGDDRCRPSGAGHATDLHRLFTWQNDRRQPTQHLASAKFEAETSRKRSSQVIVPCTVDPFLSSIVTVSLFSFIKNLFDG